MANEFDKRDINNTFFENVISIKEEYESHDSDNLENTMLLCKSETVIDADIEFRDFGKDDIAKQYEISTIHIKTELFSPKICSDRIHEEIKIENNAAYDVKTESSSKLLTCDQCHEEYQDYCENCQMLVHILDRSVFGKNEICTEDDLPKNVLEIRESIKDFGVFALKLIPKNVNFGPFIRVSALERSWKIKEGRLIISNNRPFNSNWMKYINLAESISEQNLLVFQNENNLYYRSTREIQEGEELLVYFGVIHENNSIEDVELNFIPPMKKDMNDVFACTFCCLGFSLMVYLAKHKTICLYRTNEEPSIEVLEIMRCPFCKIYMEQKEYLEYHISYCREKNDRLLALPSKNDQATEIKKYPSIMGKRKKQQREMFKCSQCKYRTIYKGDLITHTNNIHYQVKAYSCEICHQRFKRRGTLKIHVINAHIDIDGAGTRQCFMCEYKTKSKSHLKEHITVKHFIEKKYKCTSCDYETGSKSNFQRHLYKHDDVKKFKCSECDFRTKYKFDLKTHLEAKHYEVDKYKCPKCEYKTSYRRYLRKHLFTHEKVKRFKCAKCDFKTNYKSSLKAHVDARHFEVNTYKCSKCNYGTGYKVNFQRHLASHSEVKRFKCTECDYTSNYKAKLQTHLLKHKTVKPFKCELCDFATYDKSILKNHLFKHEIAKRIKCPQCKFETNYKSNLKVHINSKHSEVKKYNCTLCNYATAYGNDLKNHLYSHEIEKRLRCPQCDFKTNYKSSLKGHINAKHSNVKNYKCAKCEYQTSYKNCLVNHLYTHDEVKRFKCTECAFETNTRTYLKTHMKTKHSEVNSDI